jgi:predicted acyl esterase
MSYEQRKTAALARSDELRFRKAKAAWKFFEAQPAGYRRIVSAKHHKALDSSNGLVFVSEPLAKPMEMSGLFSGHLEFIANKSDFDFQVSLYELSPEGDYFQLAPYWSRASYVQDLTHRNLLVAGKRQSLDFRSVRLMSRQLKAGSRLVAVLSIIQEPGREIDYGTGKEVVDESIADAKTPLQISWFGGSYLDLPVRR